MDGVAIVARAHLTHEQQLMDLVPLMPQAGSSASYSWGL